jgi:transglutaminase-like putative cysteine protease
VKVEGSNNGVLYSIGQPKQWTGAEARVGSNPADVSGLTPAGHLRNGDEYQVTGSVVVASVDQLKAAGTDYPAWVSERYLTLPADLPRRIRLKAREVVRGAGGTPYERAATIETYLRSFPVSYDVPNTPSGRDTVDYFLFGLQRSYFGYRASAMAVMLRSLGIPARVASSYAVDGLQREGDSDTFNLTERNAFAWPEVYFPGIGWVEFSPTPSQPRINRPGTPAVAPKPSDATDPNLRGEGPIDLGIDSAGPGKQPDAAAQPGGGSGRWPMIIALAVVGGLS